MRRIVVTAAMSAMVCISAAAGQPAPRELLDKYEAIRGKFTSYIVETEEHGIIRGQYPGYRGPVDMRVWAESRFDGTRHRVRSHRWGKMRPDRPPFEKGKGPYNENLWDGTRYYQYVATGLPEPGKPENGDIRVQTKDGFAKSLPDTHKSYANGVGLRETFYGDEEVIGARLRQAKRIRVRPKRETVRGSECYVIEAVSRHGKYTVWLDPRHSYQIARARVEKIGDRALHLGKKQRKTSSTISTLEVERFEEIDGVWIPMEGVYEWTHRFGEHRERFQTTKRRTKRTKVTFSPDHEALKSFVPDYPNGTKVRYPRKMGGIEFKWKDGEIETQVDEETLNETVDQIMQLAKADQPKTAGAAMVEVSPPARIPARAPAAKDPSPPAPAKDPARSALLWSLLGVSALLLGVGAVGIVRHYERVALTQA